MMTRCFPIPLGGGKPRRTAGRGIDCVCHRPQTWFYRSYGAQPASCQKTAEPYGSRSQFPYSPQLGLGFQLVNRPRSFLSCDSVPNAGGSFPGPNLQEGCPGGREREQEKKGFGTWVEIPAGLHTIGRGFVSFDAAAKFEPVGWARVERTRFVQDDASSDHQINGKENFSHRYFLVLR